MDFQYRFQNLFPKQNNGSVLIDDGRVLELIIKLYRPRTVVEIGTFVGASAMVMANAFDEINFPGIIHTVDRDDHRVKELAAQYGLDRYIIFHHEDSYKFALDFSMEKLPIDIIFYDGTATKEQYERHYKALAPLLTKGGLFVMHDYKTRAKGHQGFLASLPPDVRFVTLPTEKGITLIQPDFL